LSEEENNYSEISSESEEEIVSSGSVAGQVWLQVLQYMSCKVNQAEVIKVILSLMSGKTDWVQNGRRRDRFSRKYDAGSKGELQNKINPLDTYIYIYIYIYIHTYIYARTQRGTKKCIHTSTYKISAPKLYY
jgi:hypothetical protein